MADWFEFTFSTAIIEPPTSSQVRLNATNAWDATKVWVRLVTNDGIDAYYFLKSIGIDTTVFLQDKNDHTQAVEYVTTAGAVDKTTYIELPVGLQDPLGTPPFSNNQAVILVVSPAVPASGPSTPGAQLVTLEQAKAHLYQAWAAGDPRDSDLQRKLDAAEAAILDYCNTTDAWRSVTATWTSGNVPRQVQAAILLVTGELWRFRGDDAAPDTPHRDPLTDFSPQVCGLLRRTRDPVLA